MQRSATSRLAGLSVPPGSIAHLGLNSRSLSASLLNLKAEQQPSDGEDWGSNRTARRRKELDEISIDSASEESLGDGPESEDEHEGELSATAGSEPNIEGDQSPLVSTRPTIDTNDAIDSRSLSRQTSHTRSHSRSSDASSAGTVPTPRSPPPTYEFATGPPLTPRAQPEAGPSNSTSDRSTEARSSRSSSPRRSSPARNRQSTEEEAISSLEESLSSLVPALLERVPSSSSERSLFRSFDEQALRRGAIKVLRTVSTEGKADGDEAEEDPNTFELSISDPPSPRSRSGSISMPGREDKGKTRGGRGGKRHIKIVDRSGGEWRDLVERPDEEVDDALDGDELSERIFKDQLPAHRAASEEGVEDPARAPSTPTLVNKRLDLERSRSSPRISSTSGKTSDRPPLPRQQSSSNASNPGEPFARDVQITGWKIVGGETKVQKDRPGIKSGTPSTGDVRNYVEVERGKIGAFVGECMEVIDPNNALPLTKPIRGLAVYECEIYLRQGTKVTRMRRYNDFVDLRDALKWAFPKLRYGGTLPKLPPKNNLCECRHGV